MKPVRSNWAGALLVCGKCSRRMEGGFGPKGKAPLAKYLRKAFGLKGRKAPLGVVETRCLGICPRGAVVLVDSRAPDRWRLVRPGDDLAALVQPPA